MICFALSADCCLFSKKFSSLNEWVLARSFLFLDPKCPDSRYRMFFCCDGEIFGQGNGKETSCNIEIGATEYVLQTEIGRAHV